MEYAEKANEDLRRYAKMHGVYLWEIASEMLVSEMTLMRWMRTPLSENKKAAYINARKYSKANGVCLWEVAVEMGVAEATLIRWLRLPFSEEKKIQFINAVDNISQNRED